uniref:Uncharacterized protein LOC100186634 n=1 Tax=Phallusia mammillata TaxID=59560 RepID=A0A6F9DHW7_9ASCI|nr:uncharacterized protein LOC100186634 [Phallusia mammillata]
MSSLQETKCFPYILAVAVLSTVLSLVILSAGIAFLTWKFRKTQSKRRASKHEGMVTIGRARRTTRNKDNNNFCNNNMRPNVAGNANTCPVVIPSIQITSNIPDDQDSKNSNRDLIYAHIRGAKSRGANTSATKANCSKPSGDYADLFDPNATKQRPINASTPFQVSSGVSSQQERTYISPVQYGNKRIRKLDDAPNDSSEVFDNESRPGMRFRIASAFRSIPSRISSTVSAIGNNLTTATPANSPRMTSSQNDAIYLSFQDVSGSNRDVPQSTKE